MLVAPTGPDSESRCRRLAVGPVAEGARRVGKVAVHPAQLGPALPSRLESQQENGRALHPPESLNRATDKPVFSRPAKPGLKPSAPRRPASWLGDTPGHSGRAEGVWEPGRKRRRAGECKPICRPRLL